VKGGWRKLNEEELRDLYTLPSVIRIIKSRRMRWAGHIAQIGEKRKAYRLLLEKPKGKSPLEDQDIGRWILERWDVVMWTALVWLRIGTDGEFL
jgi:hypothetical protein